MTAEMQFLIYAISCFGLTLLALRPLPRLPGFLLVPVFLLTLPLTELTIHFLVFESLGAIWFVTRDVLTQDLGRWALLLFMLNLAGLLWLVRCQLTSGAIFDQALAKAGVAQEVHPHVAIRLRDWLLPQPIRPKAVEKLADIAYADAHLLQRLDIYRGREASLAARPVLLYIHGGGWYLGDKSNQGLPLLHFMAEQGWLCVSVNYRLSPEHRFPAHIIDVRHAIHWTRENIATYGGDPDFIALAGGSAGGHLSALAGLTNVDPAFQPGFETADTRVQAFVALYGMYDFEDLSGLGVNAVMRELLADKIMPASLSEDPALWRSMSPLSRVHGAAPPCLIIHGSHDPMMSPEDSRHFATTLRAVSASPVVLALLPGAQHAFDLLPSPRTATTVRQILRFLTVVKNGAISTPETAGT